MWLFRGFLQKGSNMIVLSESNPGVTGPGLKQQSINRIWRRLVQINAECQESQFNVALVIS